MSRLVPDWQVAVSVAALAVTLWAIFALHRRIKAAASTATWNVSDLLCEDGRLSPWRLGYLVGSGALTWGFLKAVWSAQITDGVVTLFLTYGALMMFPQTVERIALAKFGVAKANGPPAVAPPKP